MTRFTESPSSRCSRSDLGSAWGRSSVAPVFGSLQYLSLTKHPDTKKPPEFFPMVFSNLAKSGKLGEYAFFFLFSFFSFFVLLILLAFSAMSDGVLFFLFSFFSVFVLVTLFAFSAIG